MLLLVVLILKMVINLFLLAIIIRFYDLQHKNFKKKYCKFLINTQTNSFAFLFIVYKNYCLLYLLVFLKFNSKAYVYLTFSAFNSLIV